MSAPPADREILVVTAVRAETRAVLATLSRPTRGNVPGFPAWLGHAGDRRVTVVQSGIGPVRAEAALAAPTTRFDLIVSVGLAGALQADLAPGDVLLPDTIVWEGASGLERHTVARPPWTEARERLAIDAALRVHTGALLSSPVVVATVAEKRAAAERAGAIAVEMEAMPIVAAAVARGIPMLALRVVLDGADVSLEGLPPDLDSSWAARARLVGRPKAWPIVAQLARELPRATRMLTRAVRLVLRSL